MGTARSSVTMPSASWAVTSVARKPARRHPALPGTTGPARLHGMENREPDDEIGAEAMVELHQADIVDEVLDPGAHGEKTVERRRQPAIHQRPAVVGKPRLRAGDEPAEGDLDEDQGEKEEGRAPNAPRLSAEPRGAVETGRHPEDGGEDRRGEEEVERQLDRRDRGHAGLQPGGDHDPADGALQPPERADGQEREREAAAERPPRPEPEERQEEHQPDEPPKLPVRPFPPVDELELGKAHAL